MTKPQAEYDRTRLLRNAEISKSRLAYEAKVRRILTADANALKTEANPNWNPEKDPGFAEALKRIAEAE